MSRIDHSRPIHRRWRKRVKRYDNYWEYERKYLTGRRWFRCGHSRTPENTVTSELGRQYCIACLERGMVSGL
jgi:hypothetical protein